MKNKAISFYTAVFLLSGLVMALQILQSRIFSVTSWYHLSFLVISMAMFGLTMGALKIYKSKEEDQRKNYGLIARKHSIAFGFFILIGLTAQLFIPLISRDALQTFATLPVAAFATGIAYYHAGIAITVCLTRAPFPVGRTYGIDLLGAGLGCIGALLLMETVDTPSAILFLSSIAFVSALLFPISDTDKQEVTLGHHTINLKKTALIFCMATFTVGALNVASPTPFLYPLWIKNKIIKMSYIDYEEWNSISRVTVMNEEVDIAPYVWGPSPIIPDIKVTGKYLVIDGDAGTPITKFDGDFSKHRYLEFDVTNVAYSLPNIKKSAIVGVGGGRDLLSAKYFGVEEVTALDVNPVQIKLLRDHPEFREYANLYNQPGVKIINEEARSWFRKNTEKLDLIQMSLIDTWAATGAGAFALSENGLYTVEAWSIFMDDLSEHGVFTVSRWSADVMDDTGRTLAVAMATLFAQGIDNVSDHIIMINSHVIATTLVSKTPFTPQQIAALEKTVKDKQYGIIMMPGHPIKKGILQEIIVAKTLKELNEIADKQFYDVSPSTDMRPFFFNQARLTKPLAVIKLVLTPQKDGHEVFHGQVKATFNLYTIIVFSFFMVAFVIIAPLLKTVEDKSSTYIKAGTLYFILIGLGFMFMEISLLQAFGIFLGHPIYGLSVVLFSLIIAAGVGSLVSEKLPLNTLPRQIIWCLTTCGYGIFLSFILRDVFYNYAEVDVIMRVLVSVAIISPAGILMGFGFPTGLSLTEHFDSRATAWFWGINGASGVLGSSLAIALNITMGIDKTLIVAGLCYALLSISFITLAQCKKNASAIRVHKKEI
ncbi:MAG: hypothetical protein COA45_04910 [Zetaproteobacteria bacterium]|nr:MAG: hypothetical protein COA45_04910 [Zetaproteobacteria bacterium]